MSKIFIIFTFWPFYKLLSFKAHFGVMTGKQFYIDIFIITWISNPDVIKQARK